MAHLVRCDECQKEFSSEDDDMMYRVIAPAVHRMADADEQQFCSKRCVALHYNQQSGLGLVPEPKASCDID